MKNLMKVALVVMALCLIFTGCQGVPFLHQHDWQDATCTTPKTCATCNETEGEALGHQGGEATCTEKAVCTVCNLPYGELKDHIAIEDDNDCTTAQTCVNCSYIFAPAAPSHAGGEATCTAKAECSRCGIAYGELAEHNRGDAKPCTTATCTACNAELAPVGDHTPGDAATCTTAQTCTVCNTELVAAGHSWNDATCTAPKTCSVCTATEGEALGHSWNDATCAAPKTCSVCSATEGDALAHSWNDATCEAPKTCSVCTATEGEALGHSWNDATCEAPKTCSVCTATEGEALPHTPSAEATCSAPQICTVCNTVLATADHNYVNGACSVCGAALPQMETTTYALKTIDGTTGAFATETTQTYELAEGVIATLNGKARFIATELQMYPGSSVEFKFPGLVSKITYTSSGSGKLDLWGSNDGIEWTHIGTYGKGTITVDFGTSYQYVKSVNTHDNSQAKPSELIVNPA